LKDIYILDLTTLPFIPSIFEKNNLKHSLKFLYDFMNDFMKPVYKDNKENIEYVPTQIFTEYFKFLFKNNKKKIVTTHHIRRF